MLRWSQFGKFLRVCAAIFTLLAPMMQDLLPKAQASVMSCCRTKKKCCCRKGAKPGDAKPAFRAATECERDCAGMLASSIKPVAPVERKGIASAPPVQIARDAQLAIILPAAPALNDLHQRPPPSLS